MKRRRVSARVHFVLVGSATIAGCWVAVGCAFVAGWCLICHRAETAAAQTVT